MFGSFLLVACTVMQAYVFWRAWSVPLIARSSARKLIIAAGALPWAIFLYTHATEHSSAGGALSGLLEIIGLDWLAMMFLTTVCMLSVDIVTGFGFFLRRLAPTLRGWALVAAGLLIVIALVQGLRAPVVRDYEVQLGGLPADLDGTVLVAISDLHLGTLLGPRWLEARVAQIQALQPDLVVLLGDIFEGHGRPDPTLLSSLRRLAPPLGGWAVNGNHESFGRTDDGTRLLEQAGFQVLSNRWVEVRPRLVLAGVDDLTRNRRASSSNDPLGQALEGRPAGATILLSHSPLQAERAAGAGATLMLSGHTHAGQIWPFGYLVRSSYPLLEGCYDVGGMPVIVGRGTGTWGPRMRLWRPSEILRITLRHPPALMGGLH